MDLNEPQGASISARLIRALRRRFPTQVIGRLPDALPYLERTTIWESGIGSLVLHRFRRNDADVPHDHSFDFVTAIVLGGYREERYVNGARGLELWKEGRMRAGTIGFRRAETIHRVHVDDGEAWTLVLRGPKRRAWSFWPDGGPVLWWEFLGCERPRMNATERLVERITKMSTIRGKRRP